MVKLGFGVCDEICCYDGYFIFQKGVLFGEDFDDFGEIQNC